MSWFLKIWINSCILIPPPSAQWSPKTSVITSHPLTTSIISSRVTAMVQPLACLYLILISFALFLSAYFPIPPSVQVGKYEPTTLFKAVICTRSTWAFNSSRPSACSLNWLKLFSEKTSAKDFNFRKASPCPNPRQPGSARWIVWFYEISQKIQIHVQFVCRLAV